MDKNQHNPFGEDPFSMEAPAAHDIPFAGFGIRLLAWFLDSILVTILAWAIWGGEVVQVGGGGFHVSIDGTQNVVWFLYFTPFWMLLSTSPGKMICGIKIVNAQGGKISPSEAGIRMAGYNILVIGAWFILGDSRKQALHDRFAGTYVIYRN